MSTCFPVKKYLKNARQTTLTHVTTAVMAFFSPIPRQCQKIHPIQPARPSPCNISEPESLYLLDCVPFCFRIFRTVATR